MKAGFMTDPKVLVKNAKVEHRMTSKTCAECDASKSIPMTVRDAMMYAAKNSTDIGDIP